jgi:hypothetical protein
MNPSTAQPALDLRDIHLPGAPPWWPPAPGWWLLAALLLLLLAWGLHVLLRRRRWQQQRARIFGALAALQTGLSRERSPEQLSRINGLLRRLALMRYPRSEVASLSGDAWLRFLDGSGGEGRFLNGPGWVLAEGPYRRQLPSDLDLDGFAALVRRWVELTTGRSA